MVDDDDADIGGTAGNDPPSASRINRANAPRYRTLSRPGEGNQRRDRCPRQRTQLSAAELIGLVFESNGLANAVREHAIALFWTEIVGEQIASKTSPASFAGVLLHASAISSTWLHELQFLKAKLIGKINSWVDANRSWLRPASPVKDIRFALGAPRRDRLIDSEQVRRLQGHHQRRTSRPPGRVPLPISDADCEAIHKETSAIEDPEIRALVDAVRTKWNR